MEIVRRKTGEYLRGARVYWSVSCFTASGVAVAGLSADNAGWLFGARRLIATPHFDVRRQHARFWMHEDLIRRLQERIRRTPSTDLECVPPIQPRPVLTVEQVEMAEFDLGFILPTLVRSLYFEVADGGYGPGWGILPLSLDEQPSIVAHDHWFRRSWKSGRPPKGWPEPFIRFCEWGCNIYSGIDCSQATCPVLRFDPHCGGQRELDLLVAECDSLAEWLTSWLDNENLWEHIRGKGTR